MARFFKKRSEMLGKRPGELVFVGKDEPVNTEAAEIRYNSETFEKINLQDNLPDHEPDSSSGFVRWINFNGLGNIDYLNNLKKMYAIPSLIMADILNTTLRPKAEELPEGFFISLKMLHYEEEKERVASEQISLIADGSRLLTFQERPGDVFDPVRKRLIESAGRIRQENAVFLTYSLLDTITDNYIDIMQKLAERIESIDDTLSSDVNETVLNEIHLCKKELLYLGRAIRPAREAVRIITKESQPLIEDKYRSYFSDLISNMVQLIETIDLYKEMCNEFLSRYNGLINDKLNETIKFLTVFSVIFLPLTLITGIYGTNFDFIPELHFRYGYLLLWISLFVITAVMIWIFKRKKWM
ncbi:MAG: magnesium/cobalt transporter CorA [Spirochaetales bacterium]|nr:magnesium/cobalt transporter CorA [Spirochaetales bacterium]